MPYSHILIWLNFIKGWPSRFINFMSDLISNRSMTKTPLIVFWRRFVTKGTVVFAETSIIWKCFKTNFTQHLLHWVCFPLWGSVTTTMNEYQTNSNNCCRFKMKRTSLKIFSLWFFSDKFLVVYVMYLCYWWQWKIQLSNLSSHISRTRFKFSNHVHSHTIFPLYGMAKSEVSD